MTPFVIHNNLKALRQSKGLAQYGLAALARVSPTTIQAAEKWGYLPSHPVRQRLATALGVCSVDIWPDLEPESVNEGTALP
jgi:DNA-binding XRE family transcriptional regulator